MNCRNCGNEIENGASFCTQCGERVQQESTEYEKSSGYAENNSGYAHNGGNARENENGGFYGAYNYQQPPQYNPYVPPVNDKAASLKDYLKWMFLLPLLNFVPGVGFILYCLLAIRYALDKTFVARSNFFKASLIVQAVSYSLFFIVLIIIVSMFKNMMGEVSGEFSGGFPSDFFYEFPSEFFNEMPDVNYPGM